MLPVPVSATPAARAAEAPAGLQLDDPVDVEDRMIKRMIRSHAVFRVHGQELTIGTEMLPERWLRLTETFTSTERALEFLRSIATRDGMPRVRALSRSLYTGTTPDDHRLLDMLARALVTRRAWVIGRKRFPAPLKANPAVLNAVNAQYRTSVDFQYLAKWEGGQHLHGYVPFDNTGHVAGRSGVTIATGFDIGQKSVSQIQTLDVSDSLRRRLLPFAGVQLKGLSRIQAAEVLGGLHAPIPVVTKEEADRLDALVHGEHLAAAARSWDHARKPGVPAFKDLPAPWQTVLFSRTFHQGIGFPKTSVAQKFYGAATAGKWKTAIEALQNYPVAADWYKTRVRQEADYLRSVPLPPAPTPPAPPAPPGGTSLPLILP